MNPVSIICPECAGSDTVRIVGGRVDVDDSIKALYGCKECGHTFVTKRLKNVETWPKDEPTHV
jgi:transposase-like protein